MFIACAYKSKIYSILQGPTASGKTYLIRLFCEMIGRKLIIYQLNKDTPLSILSGQYIYNKNNTNEYENILENKNELKDNEKENELLKIQNKIEEERILNPLNSFKYEESIFIQTLKSGENIILMDGIESAPINIIETLSSLCEDNPNFTISLKNSIITFKKKIDKDSLDNNEKNKIIKINDDFYIFFTFDPTNKLFLDKINNSNIKLKCLLFFLSSIDSSLENSSQFLYGTFIEYFKKEIKDIPKILSIIHQIMKSKNIGFFAGNSKLSSRILIFMKNMFLKKSKMINRIKKIDSKFYKTIGIYDCYQLFYYNSIINKEEIDINLIKTQFEKEIISYINENAIIGKNSIQGTIEYYLNLEFIDFIFECKKIKIKNLKDIVEKIDKQIINIDKNKRFQFQIVNQLLKDIDSKKITLEEYNLTIGEFNSFKNKELQKQIKKFILFINLYKNGQIYNKNVLLFEKCYNLAKEIHLFINKKDYNLYKNIIIKLNNDLNLFEILDYCIPKKKFEDIDLKYAYLWLDLFSCFYKEKVNFSIIFNNNENLKFEFNEGKKTLNPEFDIEKNFKLSKKSKFNLEDKKGLECQDEYIFYFILKQLSKYKSPSKKDISNELKKIKKGEILNKEIWDKLIINPNEQLYNLFYIKDKHYSKMKFIWLLVYYLEEKMLEYFENSISIFEMDWVKNIKSKLTQIDNIEPIIEASKEIEQFLIECNYLKI